MTAAPSLTSASSSADTRFPNLSPEVVAGYLAAPDTLVAEVIDGVLSRMPRPRPRHARAAGVLNGDLHAPFGRKRCTGDKTPNGPRRTSPRRNVLPHDVRGNRSGRKIHYAKQPEQSSVKDWVVFGSQADATTAGERQLLLPVRDNYFCRSARLGTAG